jgi:hypothetical protein
MAATVAVQAAALIPGESCAHASDLLGQLLASGFGWAVREGRSRATQQYFPGGRRFSSMERGSLDRAVAGSWIRTSSKVVAGRRLLGAGLEMDAARQKRRDGPAATPPAAAAPGGGGSAAPQDTHAAWVWKAAAGAKPQGDDHAPNEMEGALIPEAEGPAGGGAPPGRVGMLHPDFQHWPMASTVLLVRVHRAHLRGSAGCGIPRASALLALSGARRARRQVAGLGLIGFALKKTGGDVVAADSKAVRAPAPLPVTLTEPHRAALTAARRGAARRGRRVCS